MGSTKVSTSLVEPTKSSITSMVSPCRETMPPETLRRLAPRR
jgi:hypothetical protein